jgi:hypothetical protein
LSGKANLLPSSNEPSNKLGFIDGTEAAPPEKVERSTAGEDGSTVISFVPNPAYEAWLRKDQMVVSWLNTTLSEEILANTISLQRMPYEHI